MPLTGNRGESRYDLQWRSSSQQGRGRQVATTGTAWQLLGSGMSDGYCGLEGPVALAAARARISTSRCAARPGQDILFLDRVHRRVAAVGPLPGPATHTALRSAGPDRDAHGTRPPAVPTAWRTVSRFGPALKPVFRASAAPLARRAPFAAQALQETVFENPSNQSADLQLRTSHLLPCEASREVALSQDGDKSTRATTIVLQQSMVQTVMRNLNQAGHDLTDDEHLGLCWPAGARVSRSSGSLTTRVIALWRRSS